MTDLQQIFTSFASFGNRRVSKEEGPVEMDGARFAKLAKDCKLLDKKFTATDVDLTFSKVKAKGQRKIGLPEFKEAIDIIAAKKGVSADDIIAKLSNTDGPSVNATQAEPNKFHDDKNLYTGVYKNGGPTNVDNPKDLSGICDRTAADVRGVKKTISATTSGLTAAERRPSGVQ